MKKNIKKIIKIIGALATYSLAFTAITLTGQFAPPHKPFSPTPQRSFGKVISPSELNQRNNSPKSFLQNKKRKNTQENIDITLAEQLANMQITQQTFQQVPFQKNEFSHQNPKWRPVVYKKRRRIHSENTENINPNSNIGPIEEKNHTYSKPQKPAAITISNVTFSYMYQEREEKQEKQPTLGYAQATIYLHHLNTHKKQFEYLQLIPDPPTIPQEFDTKIYSRKNIQTYKTRIKTDFAHALVRPELTHDILQQGYVITKNSNGSIYVNGKDYPPKDLKRTKLTRYLEFAIKKLKLQRRQNDCFAVILPAIIEYTLQTTNTENPVKKIKKGMYEFIFSYDPLYFKQTRKYRCNHAMFRSLPRRQPRSSEQIQSKPRFQSRPSEQAQYKALSSNTQQASILTPRKTNRATNFHR